MKTYDLTFYQYVKSLYTASVTIKTNLSEEQIEERLNSIDLMNGVQIEDHLDEVFGDEAEIGYVDGPDECVDCTEYEETTYKIEKDDE
jgi:uncharacterized protein with ACT and thioredoxin-like domain